METDNMLKQFFSEQKQEIADNGFSRRVMQKLPEQRDRSWIVWVFAAIGMAISLYFGLNSGLLNEGIMLLTSIPVLYLVAGIAAFPLIGTAGFFLMQEKNYRVI